MVYPDQEGGPARSLADGKVHLKVLLLYYEPFPSGQTTHVLSLVNGLEPGKYELVVLYPDHLNPPICRDGVRAIAAPIRKLAWKREAVTGLAGLIRREQFDIVHIHSQEAGLVARPIARAAGARGVIYTPQTTDIRRSGAKRLYMLSERVLAGLTDRLVSVSEVDRQRLLGWGIPAGKVVTIPNGVEIPSQEELSGRNRLRPMAGIPDGAPVVLQVGRLSAQKAPEDFVEGAARVAARHPAAHFVMVGDGPLSSQIHRQVEERQLEGRVHLLGRVENAAGLMREADVVTLTSRWEGMPYSILEAMARGKPVVSTDVNGCAEAIEHGVTGFLVKSGEIEAWTGNVLELLDDPAMANRMGQQGRRRAAEHFSVGVMLARIDTLYRQVADHSVRISV